MDTAAAYADGPTSMHAPAQPPRPVARNAWKKAATAPVLPPVSIIGAGKLVLASQPSLPLLPATPSPVYPPGPSGVKGMCPVSDGSGMRRDLGQERCLPDYGLLMGGSFRMGWGPGGLFAGHLPGGSAARVGLQRVVVGSGTVRHPASKEHQDRLRGRLEAQLRLHYDASLPDAEVGTAPAPPRWRLRCQRTGGELRALTHKYIALCNEHAAQVSQRLLCLCRSGAGHGDIPLRVFPLILIHLFPILWTLQVSGSEHAVERAILRHQAAAWELIHALFSSLPAEESAQEEDQTMTADGDAFPDGSGAPTMRLAAMQRRAELSRWLRDRSRAAVERAARAAPPGPEGTPARLLALLSGHQLAAAAAAAAVSGDVRLATLLATAGSSGAAKQQIAAQLAVWRDAGFEAHIDPTLRQVYQLLAGHAEQVVPSMALDWRRALGVHLWYVCPPNATAVASMDSYVAAVEAGEAPAPAPIYTEWRRGGGNSSGGMLMLEDGSMHGVDEGLTDVNFELLRLFCVLAEDTGRDPALVGDAVLPRLLRPSGSSPDPLDYSLSWHMLCVLRSLGAVAGSQPEADAAAATAQMGFIAQLEAVGGMAHWAVYAALHIPDAGRRERVVKELLSVHCPEWDGDEEVVTFLLESLQVPKEWVAEARALWARYRQDTIALLEEQIEGGDWAAAHATLCERVAPRWLLSGGAALSNLSDALSELEPHANEVDRAAGAGSWQRGGGLYAAFLFLRELYASLTSDMGDEQPALSYEERMQACAELCERLNDASAAVAVEARGGPHGGMAAVEGEGVPLRRAALARMAQDLALWVLGDARGEGACPGPDHAAMVAGLRSLRHGSAAAAVQMGAVSLAAGIA